MLVLLNVFLGVYFGVLCIFCFVAQPLICCCLLLLSALIICVYSYVALGVGWYIILFCLVYIGGVYILFIFVSVCSPNVGVLSSVNWQVVFSVVMLVVMVSFGIGYDIVLDKGIFSDNLCLWVEGGTYCLLGGVLLLGLVVVSGISSFKDAFYR